MEPGGSSEGRPGQDPPLSAVEGGTGVSVGSVGVGGSVGASTIVSDAVGVKAEAMMIDYGPGGSTEEQAPGEKTRHRSAAGTARLFKLPTSEKEFIEMLASMIRSRRSKKRPLEAWNRSCHRLLKDLQMLRSSVRSLCEKSPAHRVTE